MFIILLVFPLALLLVFGVYIDRREDVDVDVHPGTSEVLAAIHEPLERRDDENDTKGSNTVVYHVVSYLAGLDWGVRKKDALMLLPVTGSSGGKRKRTVVR